MASRSTTRLLSWDRVSNSDWPTLLIGNGASINVCSDFSYKSLLSRSNLRGPASLLFQELATSNFEEVLESLWHAERVLSATGYKADFVVDLYEHLRTELAGTIRRVHIAKSELTSGQLKQIADEIDSHRLVFTTNYDLILYWALMEHAATTTIGDFFWSARTFDPLDADLRGNRTGLLYLHGGIHLWQDINIGVSGKWTNQGNGLLNSLTSNFLTMPHRRPLIVSEATAAKKLSVIRRSDYLTFARQQLIDDDQPTVVFGSRLGEQDTHIVRGLNAGGRRRIAVAIQPGTATQIAERTARFVATLPHQDLVFFDSKTHPLGDPSLHVR